MRNSLGITPNCWTRRSSSAFCRRVRALVTLGEDEFVLQGMFEAGKLGDPNLVAMRFEEQAAQHVRQMGAEFAALDGMAPELALRPLRSFQLYGDLGLAARHQRHEFRVVASANKIASSGRRVAGMQRRHQIHPALRQFGIADRAFDETHPLEPACLGDGFRRFDQIVARFDRIDLPASPFLRRTDRRGSGPDRICPPQDRPAPAVPHPRTRRRAPAGSDWPNAGPV